MVSGAERVCMARRAIMGRWIKRYGRGDSSATGTGPRRTECGSGDAALEYAPHGWSTTPVACPDDEYDS